MDIIGKRLDEVPGCVLGKTKYYSNTDILRVLQLFSFRAEQILKLTTCIGEVVNLIKLEFGCRRTDEKFLTQFIVLLDV